MSWYLTRQLNAAQPAQSIAIDAPCIVGRQHGVAICLPSSKISKLHAELIAHDDHVLVRDKDSTNGTFVNGQRVAEDHEAHDGDIIQFAELVFRLTRHSVQETSNTRTIREDVLEQAQGLIQFEALMSERQVTAFFQPIVSMDDFRTVAYELLGRGKPAELRRPDQMFAVAQHLGLEVELSELLRTVGVTASEVLSDTDHLFVNTHPSELTNLTQLESSLQRLRETHPEQQLTLELHEASVTEAADVQRLRDILNELNMGLAYDDFGAGQARLLELVEVPPDYLKFDIKLIRGIDVAGQRRQQMLASLVHVVRDLGISPLAEGVETVGESTVCRHLEFELAQGFFYGRPTANGQPA